MDLGRVMVKKTNGKRPTLPAISLAAATYKQEKGQRGRPLGSRKTTKQEDRQIITTFHKKRPPGYGVDSEMVHSALPAQLRRNVSRKTVIRRLADKGLTPKKKRNKSDPNEQLKKRRLQFCRKHRGKTAAQWKSQLQAVGDLKTYTWYPRELHGNFQRYRASWTYMTEAESKQGAFQRPKRWFSGQEWKKTKQSKVFSLTASNGQQLTWCVPKNYTGELWAHDVRTRVALWLKRIFPSKRSFQVLLDGEKALRSPVAKRALKENNISLLPDWPKYSPDLNPQEHVWGWAEKELRKISKKGESFEMFQQKVVTAVNKYPGADKLVASMARKVKDVLEKNTGEMLDD